jgi:uncharacterized protein YdhG (YjbR/CyaY superfamily)
MVRFMSVVDEYFAGLDPAARTAFERVRAVAMEVAPQAEAGTSYGMAALLYQGKPLIGFRAAQRHLSVFPFSAEAIEAVRGRLGGFDVSKGTVRFSADRPIPDEVLRDMLGSRLDEISS